MDTAAAVTGTVLSRLADLVREEDDERGSADNEDADVLLLLKEELTAVHAALRDRADMPPVQLDEQTKAWAGDARELAYDVEDAVDAFLARAAGADAATGGGGFFKALLLRAAGLSRSRRGAAAVAELEPGPPPAAVHDPRPAAPYKDASEIVGVDAARDAVIKKLSDDDDDDEASKQRLKVVSIVGFAGLGKTTLAKVVYDTLRPLFDCGAFVSVSINPDMNMVLENMLRQLDDGGKYGSVRSEADGEEEPADQTQLADQLKALLRNKRYLIVVDDIWETPSWEMIRQVLVENNCGSRIITTTRNFNIAEQSGSPYELKPLSLDSSKILFCRRIFGHDEEPCLDEDFAKISDKILRKCAGVPIAILAISSLWAGKTGDKKEWYKVHDSVGSTLENSCEVKNMRMALSLGYYMLPAHLRSCLLYLSIFPQDYEIRRDRLIWRWIAEGFIHCENQGESLFELGECYFKELVNRSMVQLLDIDYSFKGLREELCCRVHFSVMDLIRSMSKDENFVTIISDDERQTSPSNKHHRLSVRGSNAAVDTMSMLQVRSVSVFCSPAVGGIIDLSRFEALRVLDLEGCDLSQSHHHLLNKHLGNLLHLRYLGLRETRISEVAEEVGELQFLQTLDIQDTDVEELPASVFRLRELMCLRFGYRTRIPRGIANMAASLQELSDICTRDQPYVVEELRSLTELRVLRITLWQPTMCEEEALVESLRGLHRLQELHIYVAATATGGGGDYGTSERPLGLLLQDGIWWATTRRLRVFSAEAASSACSPLRRLLPPSWVGGVSTAPAPRLSVLLVQVAELRQADVEALGRLPLLETLRVEPYEMRETVVVDGSGAFPRLKECRLRNSDLGLVIRRGAMPRLRVIEFCFGVRLTKDLGNGGFDFGLSNLGCLEEATVYIYCKDATEEEAEEAEAAIQHAADIHPNHASFDVNTYGEELMRFDDDD